MSSKQESSQKSI